MWKRSILMDPLPTCRRVLTWICVLPAIQFTSKWEKGMHLSFSFVNCLCIVIVTTGSVGYFWKYVQIDLEESLYALYQVAAYIPLINGIIVTFLLRNQITSIFKNLSKIHESGKKLRNYGK